MTPVSIEHIKQLQALLMRMRAYLVTKDGSRPSGDNIMRCEQLGHDHMSLTDKGHRFIAEHADGIDLDSAVAYKLVHVHFRDLTYGYLAGTSSASAAYVIAQFDEQLKRYAEFLAEHTPLVTLEPDSDLDMLEHTLHQLPNEDLSQSSDIRRLQVEAFSAWKVRSLLMAWVKAQKDNES